MACALRQPSQAAAFHWDLFIYPKPYVDQELIRPALVEILCLGKALENSPLILEKLDLNIGLAVQKGDYAHSILHHTSPDYVFPHIKIIDSEKFDWLDVNSKSVY